jgi:hypothetical protein
MQCMSTIKYGNDQGCRAEEAHPRGANNTRAFGACAGNVRLWRRSPTFLRQDNRKNLDINNRQLPQPRLRSLLSALTFHTELAV